MSTNVFPTSVDIQMQFSGSAGAWTSVAGDLRADVPITCKWGIQSSQVDARVAEVGTLEFALNNSQRNSANTIGYYSPWGDNRRAGFDVGTPVRLAITYSGSTFYKGRGTIAEIDPVPGQHRERITRVVVTDWMDEAASWKISGLATMVEARPDEAVASLINNVPVKPGASTLSTAQMTLPYLNIAVRDEETTAIQEFDRLARTEFGYIYIRGNTTAGGEFVFEDRRARFNAACPIATLTDTLVGYRMPMKREDGFANLRLTVHPRRLGLAAEVLFQFTNPVIIGASQTLTIAAEFRDPNSENARIAATSITPPVAGVDYLFGVSPYDNSLAAFLQATYAIGSNSLEATLRNDYGSWAWLSWFQVRGRGLYDYEPVRLEMSAGSAAAGRWRGQILDYDMAYQHNVSTASSIGQWIIDNYSNTVYPKTQKAAWVANTSAAHMLAALQAEPGARLTLYETVADNGGTQFINGVTLRILKRGLIECEVILTENPTAATNGTYWVLGTSQLGTGTRLAL